MASYRHKNTGNTYTLHGISEPGTPSGGILYRAKMVAHPGEVAEVREGWVHERWPDALAVYEGHGEVWARSRTEFDDRFELIPEEGPKSPEQLRAERFKKTAASPDAG